LDLSYPLGPRPDRRRTPLPPPAGLPPCPRPPCERAWVPAAPSPTVDRADDARRPPLHRVPRADPSGPRRTRGHAPLPSRSPPNANGTRTARPLLPRRRSCLSPPPRPTHGSDVVLLSAPVDLLTLEMPPPRGRNPHSSSASVRWTTNPIAHVEGNGCREFPSAIPTCVPGTSNPHARRPTPPRPSPTPPPDARRPSCSPPRLCSPPPPPSPFARPESATSDGRSPVADLPWRPVRRSQGQRDLPVPPPRPPLRLPSAPSG